MRLTNQYFWNIIFTIFFLVLIFLGAVILEGEAYMSYADLDFMDYVIISLASFRLIRLVINDRVTAFFREQFWDAKETKTKVVLTKPKSGPRRTLADLLSCPWCFGIWSAATITFFYLLTPAAYFPILVLAIAGVATLFHQLACLLGHKAEQAKRENERGF